MLKEREAVIRFAWRSFDLKNNHEKIHFNNHCFLGRQHFDG